MKVIYVYRKPDKHTSAWKRFLKEQLFVYLLRGQDGFFEGSLWTAFPKLDVVSIKQAIKMAPNLDKTHDWIIVNFKCYGKGKEIEQQDLSWLKLLRNCRKALFINNASANLLPEENLLNLFDVIFKRELLKDLDRYNVKSATKEKLYTTMLSCLLVPAYVLRLRKSVICIDPIRVKEKQRFEHDVSFIGANRLSRRNVLTELKKTSINFYGGLYDHCTGHPLDWEGVKHPMEKKSRYIQTITQSRINLALEGIGVFTFRHLDIWYAGAFMLSVASILDIQLPGGTPKDGVHFASFRDHNELKEKISFYLANESERSKIALTGRKFFQSIYDFSVHGQYITDILQKS